MNAHGGTKLQSEYGEQKVVLVTCCWKQIFNNWANNDFETLCHQKTKAKHMAKRGHHALKSTCI